MFPRTIYTQHRAAFSLGENFRRKRLFLIFLDSFLLFNFYYMPKLQRKQEKNRISPICFQVEILGMVP